MNQFSNCPPFGSGICEVPLFCQQPQNTMGYSVDPLQQPSEMFDDNNGIVPFTQSPSFQPPIFLNIESARRDTTLYPNSWSFRLHLPQPLAGIRSLEMVDFSVPTTSLNQTPPDSRYFFVSNGLLDATGKWEPQGILAPIMRTLDREKIPSQIVMRNPLPQVRNDIGGVTVNSRPNAYLQTPPLITTYQYPDFAMHAYTKVIYDAQRSVQYITRHGWRRVKYFSPEYETISYLDFTICDRKGVPLDSLVLDVELNWQATLMVQCRRS